MKDNYTPMNLLYLINLFDGLQILICFGMELHLYPLYTDTHTFVNEPSQRYWRNDLTNKTSHYKHLNLYIIIILMGWILKPLLSIIIDLYTPPYNFIKEPLGTHQETADNKKRLNWLILLMLSTSLNCLVTGLCVTYLLHTYLIVGLLTVCGIGLSICTAISESLIFTKLRTVNNTERAIGISLMMAIKVLSVAAALGYIIFLPTIMIKLSLLMYMMCIYTGIITPLLFEHGKSNNSKSRSNILYEHSITLPDSSMDFKFNITRRLNLWKMYLHQNRLIFPLILLFLLLSSPDLQTVLTLFHFSFDELLPLLRTILPIIIQCSKLCGIIFFLFGFHRVDYTILSNFVTIGCLLLRFLILIIILLFSTHPLTPTHTLNLLISLIFEAFASGVAAELAFLSLLMILCQRLPHRLATTSVSLIFISSESISFLNKLEIVWSPNFTPPTSSLHILLLNIIWIFFYALSILLLALITDPTTFGATLTHTSINPSIDETAPLINLSGYTQKGQNPTHNNSLNLFSAYTENSNIPFGKLNHLFNTYPFDKVDIPSEDDIIDHEKRTTSML